MITIGQINAESQSPELTPTQQLALEMLIKSYQPYRTAVGRWPAVSARIDAEQILPSVKTQGLKAILTALSKLPPVVVESSGTDKSPSFFSAKANWDELAQDALNILYDIPITTGSTSFVLVQRTIGDLILNDAPYTLLVN